MSQKKYKIGDRVWFVLSNVNITNYYWKNVKNRFKSRLDFDKLDTKGTIIYTADENDFRIEIELDRLPCCKDEVRPNRITLLEQHVYREE